MTWTKREPQQITVAQCLCSAALGLNPLCPRSTSTEIRNWRDEISYEKYEQERRERAREAELIKLGIYEHLERAVELTEEI